MIRITIEFTKCSLRLIHVLQLIGNHRQIAKYKINEIIRGKENPLPSRSHLYNLLLFLENKCSSTHKNTCDTILDLEVTLSKPTEKRQYKQEKYAMDPG